MASTPEIPTHGTMRLLIGDASYFKDADRTIIDVSDYRNYEVWNGTSFGNNTQQLIPSQNDVLEIGPDLNNIPPSDKHIVETGTINADWIIPADGGEFDLVSSGALTIHANLYGFAGVSGGTIDTTTSGGFAGNLYLDNGTTLTTTTLNNASADHSSSISAQTITSIDSGPLGISAENGGTITTTDVINNKPNGIITINPGGSLTATNIYSTDPVGIYTFIWGDGTLVVDNYDTSSTAGVSSVLDILQGHVTINTDLAVGRQLGDFSTVKISGSGAQFVYDPQLIVGDAGSGTFYLRNAADITLPGGLILGNQSHGDGTLTVGVLGGYSPDDENFIDITALHCTFRT